MPDWICAGAHIQFYGRDRDKELVLLACGRVGLVSQLGIEVTECGASTKKFLLLREIDEVWPVEEGNHANQSEAMSPERH